MRIGIGHDLHRLEEGRPLWLGGTLISSDVGPIAHSDGDVLLHALIDALLGAMGDGDIGEHFPDTDPANAGRSSLSMLAWAQDRLGARGMQVVHVDGTIFLDRVRLSGRKQEMADRIRGVLGLEPGRVNVKAKTMEGCDAVGRGEAVAAEVIVLVDERAGER